MATAGAPPAYGSVAPCEHADHRLSVVVAAGGDTNCVIGDLVDESVLVGVPSGPVSGEVAGSPSDCLLALPDCESSLVWWRASQASGRNTSHSLWLPRSTPRDCVIVRPGSRSMPVVIRRVGLARSLGSPTRPVSARRPCARGCARPRTRPFPPSPSMRRPTSGNWKRTTASCAGRTRS